jgi:hypothetical protein
MDIAYATAADLALELGITKLDEQTEKRFTRWLAAVEARIRNRIPDLDTLVEEREIPVALLVDIVVSVAARHARNPDGLKTKQTAVDDLQVRRDFDPIGRFSLHEAEWDLLIPAPEIMFSIQMGASAYEQGSLYE